MYEFQQVAGPFSSASVLQLYSLHDRVVINSTSGSDIHDGREEVVFFYSVYRFFSGDWSQNTAKEVLNYSLTALSCRDNSPVCVNEPANQRCEELRHYFISWSCDCHTFVNPLRNAISVHVCLSSLSLNEMPSFL